MAVPVYSTDMTDIFLDTGGTTTGWTAVAISGSGPNAVAVETDYFVQGIDCISRAAFSSGQKGGIYNHGSTITVPTDGAILVWIVHLTPNSLATKASGGLRVWAGNATTAFKLWNVDGSDTNVFGGWTLGAVNPTITQDASQGSPTSVVQYVGGGANLPGAGPSKGNPFAIDAMRFGRCELLCVAGEVGNYATFSGANSFGDDVTRRWGLLSLNFGSYRMSGLFVMGTSGTAVDFRDSNRIIFIRDHDRVTTNFNGFEVRHASSNIVWSNIAVTALGTVSRGVWTTTDNATVSLTDCVFTGMDTFDFKSNTTVTGCTFRGCNAITMTSAGSFLSSLVTGSTVATDSSALVWNLATDPDGKLDSSTFVKGTGTTHAIEFGTSSPLTMTLTDVTFSGYGADASTSAAIHIKRTAGTVTININGGTTPTYKSDGATVVIVAGSVSATVICKTTEGVSIENARVHVYAAAGGPYPYQTSVSFTNSGTTATVTHTAHGLATNDKILIDGGSAWQINGVYSITVINADTYTYIMPSDPGLIIESVVATFVVLDGLTDASGTITMSRVFSSSQPISGRVRKSSGAPFFKTGLITGTVSNTTGFSTTITMVSDE